MAVPIPTTPMRPAGKIERRCITRHSLGFYGNITVGGLYIFRGSDHVVDRSRFTTALKYCITRHPILSASIEDADSEAPAYVRPVSLDLRNHLHYLQPLAIEDDNEHEEMLINDFAEKLNDIPCEYSQGIPAWKLVVIPLLAPSEKSPKKFWVGFSYSHSHGDGKSSLIFHRTLLQGLQMGDLGNSDIENVEIIQTYNLPKLLPSLEDTADLQISWSFLLSPLLSTYLPTWLSSCFGFGPGISSNPHAWKATPSVYNPGSHRTGLQIICISPRIITNMLIVCQSNGTKLTGILHQAITYGMTKELATIHPDPKFVATTAIDLRKVVSDIGENDMINCFSGTFELLESYASEGTNDEISETVWEASRKTSARLAERACTLTNQPIGLLRYLRNFRPYMLDLLGKEREGSYELSNIGVLDPKCLDSNVEATDWTIQRMIFFQPANAIGSAINFNVASIQGGELIMTATWQCGILGMEDEDKCVQRMLDGIKEFMTRVSKA